MILALTKNKLLQIIYDLNLHLKHVKNWNESLNLYTQQCAKLWNVEDTLALWKATFWDSVISLFVFPKFPTTEHKATPVENTKY